jgi:hypothetical protein
VRLSPKKLTRLRDLTQLSNMILNNVYELVDVALIAPVNDSLEEGK